MGMPMSMLSLCGVIALAGIVVNDSLVLVSYVNSHRQAGMPLHRAVREAGMVRFRPILLTSLTTAAGITPLMLEKSVQAQFLIPMAVALAYGVLFSTVITLLLVPASYLMIEDLQNIFRWLYGRGPALAGAAGGQSLDTMSQGLASQRLASQALIDADEVAPPDPAARGVLEAEPKGGESVPASSGGMARGSE
jgi:predicted RND superfamily exporter protein